MKYPQYVHWSEGQFLQPHHFQQMQRSLIETIVSERALYTPYPEGLVSIEIDEDALRSRRASDIISELSVPLSPFRA